MHFWYSQLSSSVLEVGAIAFVSFQLLLDVVQVIAGYHREVLSS